MSTERAPGVDVWRIELDADPGGAAEVLSTAEAERAARLAAERDRRRFVVAHAALRAILACYLGVDAAGIVFSSGAHGKPGLADSDRLQFNLAHSAELAVLAVARGRRVGIDVEAVRAVRLRDQLMARFFSEAEARACATVPDGERDRAFLEIWTRKEAVLKAIGVGVGGHLGKISVPQDAATVALEGTWTVRDLPDCGDYVGAVAAEGSGLEVRCRRLDFG